MSHFEQVSQLKYCGYISFLQHAPHVQLLVTTAIWPLCQYYNQPCRLNGMDVYSGSTRFEFRPVYTYIYIYTTSVLIKKFLVIAGGAWNYSISIQSIVTQHLSRDILGWILDPDTHCRIFVAILSSTSSGAESWNYRPRPNSFIIMSFFYTSLYLTQTTNRGYRKQNTALLNTFSSNVKLPFINSCHTTFLISVNKSPNTSSSLASIIMRLYPKSLNRFLRNSVLII
jgi:hypothetical protein